MNVERFEATVERLRQQYEITGVAAAVVSHHELVHAAGYGHALNNPGKRITPDHSFAAQSLTKPVFAYFVLNLAQQGLLDLDRPLRRYLDASYIAHDARGDAITARQVLTHCCGLPNWRNEHLGLQFVYNPGEHFNYSGEGYCYLQLVIETLLEQPIEEALSPLLSRLFMSASSMQILPRDHIFRSIFPLLNSNAAFALMTTANDYVRFIQQMLATEDDIAQSMLQKQTQVGRQPLAWGQGWGLMPMGGGKHAFWHWGAGAGARNFALGFPGLGFGMVLLTNGDDENGLGFCRDVIVDTLSQLPLPTMMAPFEWLLPPDAWHADGE